MSHEQAIYLALATIGVMLGGPLLWVLWKDRKRGGTRR